MVFDAVRVEVTFRRRNVYKVVSTSATSARDNRFVLCPLLGERATTATKSRARFVQTPRIQIVSQAVNIR